MLPFITTVSVFGFAGIVASYLLWREVMLDKIAKRQIEAIKDGPARKRGWQ